MVADRYLLQARLGQGGMGVVWHAHDTVLGRAVAVKEVVLPPTLPEAERRAAEARVMRGARAAARLNHPGAVTVYDVVHDQGYTFVVMELVQAPTLADLIQAKGPLPPGRVAEIGGQLAGVLEAAHRAGIVHRDVKPGNVMVPEDGGVKLADFGIASLQGDPQLTATGLVVGSPAYMAPEQASGQPSGPPADMWALGATLFYTVEGAPPFDKGALIPTLAAVVNEDPRPMRRAGRLAPVIGTLLAKDPTARPSASKLRDWLSALVDRARPVPSPEVPPAQGPGGTVPLPPAAPAPTPDPAVPPASSPAAAAPGPSQRSQQAPAFQPSQTPAWAAAGQAPNRQPSRPVLPPAPPVHRRPWRPLLGLLGLLLVGGLALAWLVSRVGTDRDGDQAAPATTRAGAGTAGTAAATRPAPSTSEQPATTQAPTTATTAAPHGALPAGWRTFTNRAGSNRAGVPPGFQVRTRQRYHATVVQEQRDPGRVFTVRSTNPANPLPQASRDYRAWARRNFDGYRELRYAEQQTYAGRTGAVVLEYEAVRDGRRVHVSHINLTGRTWGYNVEFITPADQWTSSKPLANQFEQAFQPLG